MTIQAIIRERGCGFPCVGQTVPGNYGGSYKVLEIGTDIQVGLPGISNHVVATLEEVDFEDEFPAMAILDYEESYRY